MNSILTYHPCNLCPRMCQVDRSTAVGFCKSSSKLKVARAALHQWEEPCISGTRGSGTVFFSGCNLGCCFCQNYKISSQTFGREITTERLSEIFLNLQSQGAHNINLVTASHYLPSIIKALKQVKDKLVIPVVYNSSGYEKPEAIQALDGFVDIFLPDLKYFDQKISEKYSKAPDYFSVATEAILQMLDQTGTITIDHNGIMKKGVIIRHMVLPSHKDDSIKILHWIKENVPENHCYISLLSQYTPFYQSKDYPEINRRITTYEYHKVLDTATQLGLVNGFMQEKSSAKEEYTPPFNLEGIDKNSK